MRASIVICAWAALLAGCATNYQSKLDDLTWGPEVEGDYEVVWERARFVVAKEYPEGLDPDLTIERDGDLWTVWQYRMSQWNRKGTRERARIRIEPGEEEGKVRVGVGVFRQINNNIENPTVVAEAKWVKGQRNVEREQYLYDRIAASWRKFEASEYWEETHRDERRTGLRPDILDRNQDVDLEGYGAMKRGDDTNPAVAGDPGHDRDSAAEKRRKEIEEAILTGERSE